MFGIGSNRFIGDRCSMYRWDHNYNIVNGVDHPRFKFGQGTNNDGTR